MANDPIQSQALADSKAATHYRYHSW